MKTVCGTMVDELILRIGGVTVERAVMTVKDIEIAYRGLPIIYPGAWIYLR